MSPNPNLLVLPSAPHLPPIRAPIHGKNLIAMPRQILLQFPRANIPHLERRVLTATNQQPAVWAEATHIHGRDVAAQSEQKLAVQGIPQFDVVVVAAARDEGAVGGKGDVVDLLLVAEQAGDGFSGLGWVPEVDCAVVAGGDEAFGRDAVDRGGFLESGACFDEFGLPVWRDESGMVVVCGAEDKVG